MSDIVTPVLVLIAAAMAAAVVQVIKEYRYFANSKLFIQQSPQSCIQPKLKELNCRVRLIKDRKDDTTLDSFSLEICGTIHASGGCESTIVNISIADITRGMQKAIPICTPIEKWQIKNSQNFCYTAKLGRLPDGDTVLSDWAPIAKIPAGCLIFPRKGIIYLRFITSLSSQDGEELACAAYNFIYKNTSPGHAESEMNIKQANNKAVLLAFATAAADGKISNRESKIIQNWTKNNIAASQWHNKIRNKFYKLLGRVIAYNAFYGYQICQRIAKTTPLKVRCNILDFCLHVACADGITSDKQLTLLKNLADWMGIHREKFRTMVENILPVSVYEAADLEISLGITLDMDKDQICRQLSKEYRKWNARVTNRNRQIETQAEQMLKLIADIRNQYA